MRKAGGRVTNPEAADSAITEWYFKGDDDGFQILLPGDEKESLVRALTETFGEPLLRDEYPHLVYETRSIGVAMMIDLESDPIHIICLRKGAIP